jgi:hypothetical protein
MPTLENQLAQNKVYPQPAISYIMIDFTVLLKDITSFFIQDINGKVVMTGKIEKAGDKIYLNNIPSGNYYLNYSIENKSITHKFVIQ